VNIPGDQCHDEDTFLAYRKSLDERSSIRSKYHSENAAGQCKLVNSYDKSYRIETEFTVCTKGALVNFVLSLDFLARTWVHIYEIVSRMKSWAKARILRERSKFLPLP
jgi:hypothetical protein